MTSYATEILVRELVRQRLLEAEHERLARAARALREPSRSWRERLSLRGIRWPAGIGAQSASSAGTAVSAASEPCA